MPFVEHKAGRDFNTFETAQAPERAGPGLWDTFEAAFKMENTVANVVDLQSRPVFEPQQNFKVRPAIQQYDLENRTNMFEQYGDAFLGVQSQDEMLYTIQRIKQEEENRDTLSRAGWLGVVAGITAGMVSPETFIPLVGAQKGWKAVRMAAGIGAATGAGQEFILGAAQETRTGAEMAFGIGANTALAGILGGTIGVLRAGERELYEAEIEGVASGRPTGVGADAVQTQSAGNIETGAQTLAKINDATGVFTNPVTQTINQTDFPTWRVLMQQASDSGLRMELNKEGIATALGGTIENRITPYMGILGRNIEEVDAAYARYFFDDNVPSFAPNVRATLGGTFNAAGKLSRAQFEDDVSRAIWNGYVHENPEVVAAAKATAKNVYEPILKEAQATGLLPEDIEVVGDKAYATRLYNIEAIQTRTAVFVEKLAKNYEKQLGARFTEDLKKFKTSQGRKTELVEDLERPADEVEAMVSKFKDDLNEFEEALPEEISALEEAIRDKRAQARAMLQGPQSTATDTARKQLLKDARDMEKAGKETLTGPRKVRTDLKRRLKNLTQSRAAVERRLARKLDLWEGSEDAALNSLRRLVSKAQTTLRKLDRVSDDKLDAEVSRIKNQFEATARAFDKGEERLTKLAGLEGTPDEDMLRLGVLQDLQTSRASRLDEIAQRLDDAEGLDRAEIRGLIEEGLTETLNKVNELNLRRGMRQQKLLEQSKKLDPKLVADRIKTVRGELPKAEGNFARKWEELGGEGVDSTAGVASFGDAARRMAEEVKDTIVGTYLRLPFSEVLQKERGSELVRVLDIPSPEIDEFLEKNISKLTKAYVRTMGPDIEITRKYGSLDWREIIRPAVDELNGKIQEIEARDISRAQKDKLTRKLNSDFEVNKRNFEAVIQRLRGTRGLPSDPDGFAYRASRTIMNLNVLRMMGMVTISSLPDLARPAMRYGLTRTFRDGFGPLVSNLKAFKLNAREAKLAGAANEITTHTRAMAVRDIADEMQRGSKFEKGVEWATNRMGMVALFDYWTQGMKTLSSSVANAKFMDALAKVNTGQGELSSKEAVRFLAENGIDGNIANDMWREVMENGGGGKVDGTWWPNTESWKSQELVNVYRAALSREVNNTIIQPGVERPLLSDANVLGRMLYQFKSFGMSSMPKVMMAGLQQRDAAFLTGSLASMGLGALSYYLWAVATGGKAYEDMLNADIEKWADEAISRSGIIATIGEAQRIGQNIPLVADYVSFSGQRQTRRPGDNLVEALLGPSFDFGQNALGVIGGIHEPTQATLAQFVRLLPYQNALGLREAIEAVQGAIGAKLPERRQ